MGASRPPRERKPGAVSDGLITIPSDFSVKDTIDRVDDDAATGSTPQQSTSHYGRSKF